MNNTQSDMGKHSASKRQEELISSSSPSRMLNDLSVASNRDEEILTKQPDPRPAIHYKIKQNAKWKQRLELMQKVTVLDRPIEREIKE